MNTIASITEQLYNLSIEAEKLESAMYDLRVKKDVLERKRAKLRNELDRLNSEADMDSIAIGQRMTMDLLRETVPEVFDL